jgi:hypothetical protein
MTVRQAHFTPTIFRKKKLYHQTHPVKLVTDIGVTPNSLFFLWHHHIVRATRRLRISGACLRRDDDLAAGSGKPEEFFSGQVCVQVYDSDHRSC